MLKDKEVIHTNIDQALATLDDGFPTLQRRGGRH